MDKGQGALEYLLLIGGAIIVAVIVITLLMSLGGGGGASAFENQMDGVCVANTPSSCDGASLAGLLPDPSTGLCCTDDVGACIDSTSAATATITCEMVSGVCVYSGSCR